MCVRASTHASYHVTSLNLSRITGHPQVVVSQPHNSNFTNSSNSNPIILSVTLIHAPKYHQLSPMEWVWNEMQCFAMARYESKRVAMCGHESTVMSRNWFEMKRNECNMTQWVATSSYDIQCVAMCWNASQCFLCRGLCIFLITTYLYIDLHGWCQFITIHLHYILYAYIYIYIYTYKLIYLYI